MTIDLLTINWQAVSSLLTAVAVSLALWGADRQRRQDAAKSGHLIQTFGCMLIAFRTAFNTHLEEKKAAGELTLTPPLSKLIEDLVDVTKEASVVSNPK